MFRSTLLTTLLSLPILSTCSNNLLNPSKVFYFDQLPSEAYDGDPDLTTYKDIIHVRKDINYLDTESGPNLFIGHPVIIPHGYDMSACPEFTNHTVFGPRLYVPAETLAELDTDDDFAIMIALSEDDVKDGELTLSVIWATDHELIGVVGNAPEELSWLVKGVFPWSISTSSVSAPASSRVEKRAKFSGFTKAIGKTFGKSNCGVEH